MTDEELQQWFKSMPKNRILNLIKIFGKFYLFRNDHFFETGGLYAFKMNPRTIEDQKYNQIISVLEELNANEVDIDDQVEEIKYSTNPKTKRKNNLTPEQNIAMAQGCISEDNYMVLPEDVKRLEELMGWKIVADFCNDPALSNCHGVFGVCSRMNSLDHIALMRNSDGIVNPPYHRM